MAVGIVGQVQLAARQMHVETALGDADPDSRHPCSPPCLRRPCAGQPFGIRWRRGGIELRAGSEPEVGSDLRPREPALARAGSPTS